MSHVPATTAIDALLLSNNLLVHAAQPQHLLKQGTASGGTLTLVMKTSLSLMKKKSLSALMVSLSTMLLGCE